jgi:DNA-binding NtrC family response regulator
MEKRVLIVDDDLPTRQMIGAVLARKSFKVDMCEDDTDAVARIQQCAYGAVVLALVSQNPRVHTDILMSIKKKASPPAVVLISAGTQVALDAELSDVICARIRKPFAIEQLVDAVENCFVP